jgi:hypothetical protein
MGTPPPNCRQWFKLSLLSGRLRYFRRGISVRLDSPRDTGIVDYAETLLGPEGWEGLRHVPRLPEGRWIVYEHKPPKLDLPFEQDQRICLGVLALSSLGFYSPDRPVVNSCFRLGRIITLYQVGNFYEN